jgi:hypothetical protein
MKMSDVKKKYDRLIDNVDKGKIDEEKENNETQFISKGFNAPSGKIRPK